MTVNVKQRINGFQRLRCVHDITAAAAALGTIDCSQSEPLYVVERHCMIRSQVRVGLQLLVCNCREFRIDFHHCN